MASVISTALEEAATWRASNRHDTIHANRFALVSIYMMMSYLLLLLLLLLLKLMFFPSRRMGGHH